MQTSHSGAFSPYLQYLRGIAALCVLLFHAAAHQVTFLKNAELLAIFPSRFGIFGVEMFFALSGYLMAIVITKDTPMDFILRRIIRIYPMFLLTALILGTLYWWVGSTLHYSPLSFLLAPVGVIHYPLNVEWTLVFEMTFYIALTLLALVGLHRFVHWIGLAWLALLVVTLLAGRAVQPLVVFLYELPLSMYCSGFAAGLAIPFLLRIGFRPFWLVPIALLILPIPSLSVDEQRLLYGFSAAIIVASAVSLGQQPLPAFLARPLHIMGDASYPLYLCHVPIIHLLYYLQRGRYDHYTLYVAAIVLPICFAIVMGALDLKLQAVLKQGLTAVPVPIRTVAAAAFVTLFIAVAALYPFSSYVNPLPAAVSP